MDGRRSSLSSWAVDRTWGFGATAGVALAVELWGSGERPRCGLDVGELLILAGTRCWTERHEAVHVDNMQRHGENLRPGGWC